MDRDVKGVVRQSSDYSKIETSDNSEVAKEDDGGVGYDGLRHRSTEDRSSDSDEQFFDPEDSNNNAGWQQSSETNTTEAVGEIGVGVASGLSQLLENPIQPQLERVVNARNLATIGNMKVKEHFSLRNPSSAVAFAQEEAIIFVDNLEQVVLERNPGNDYITAKQATVSTPGLVLMRIIYVMVALLMSGFLFAICLEICLYLFFGLAIRSGLSSQNFRVFVFFGALLAIPIFITALSQIMVFADSFVFDTWRGSKFMKTVTSWNNTFVDWLSLFLFFLGPILVGSVALCTKTDNWWEITSISWFVCVLSYYLLFVICVIYYEVVGCLDLVRHHPKLRQFHNPEQGETTLKTLTLVALEWRMKQALSGHKQVKYTSYGSSHHPGELSYDEVRAQESFASHIGPFSRLTRQRFMSRFYKVFDEPVLQYNVDEVLGFTPFITRSSWSIESIYCRSRQSRFIAIIDGASAITKQQAKSSLSCVIIARIVTLFAIVGALVWFGAGPVVIILVIILYALLVYKSMRKSLGLYSVYEKMLTHEDGKDRQINIQRESNALYQVHDKFRISEPTLQFCWIMLGLGVVLFFIIPIIAFIRAKNYRILIVFIIVGLIFALRNIFNAPACIQELGSLEGIEVNNNPDEDDDGLREWREKHRLGRIISEVSHGRTVVFWVGVFLAFITMYIGLFLAAFAFTAEGETSFPFASKDEFFYSDLNSLKYASCSLGRDMKSPAGVRNSLADVAFLASAANLDDNAAQRSLDEWFGVTVAENLSGNVTAFRSDYQNENGVSSVSYKLFDFPQQDLKFVSVRGTKTPWDVLSDAQLWSCAMLFQLIRLMLPLGEIWTPILPYLVKFVSIFEDDALKEVSYYKETTAFVQSLKDKNYTVQITGHSLGGGIAMITGAQTEIPSIGVSGPNAMLSRKTFDPPVSVDALNKFTFNIVPDLDPVPRFDDIAQNYQHIECRASGNRFFDCHMDQRTLCEILYTCGSEGRPIPCACVNKYDYDLPTSINGKNFSDYCTDK